MKKINMIDILGMLLPGGLMLLLLESDLHILNHLRTALWIEADKLLWTIVFLCLSYFVGMLLHEAGSIIEKILWTVPSLNPRVYAAAATGLLAKYPERVITGKSPWYRSLPKLLQIACAIILSGTVVIIALGYRQKFFHEVCSGSAIVIGIAIVTQWKQLFNKEFRNEESRQRMRAIIRDEDLIRKQSGTNDENARRLGLFSGYYSMLRSILMVFVILQIYVYLQSNTATGGTGSWLWVLDNTISNKRSFLFWRYVTVLILVLRYWHYSCARFLYVYRGYVENTFTKPANAVATLAARPVISNAKMKAAEAKQTVKRVNNSRETTEALKKTTADAKSAADTALAKDPKNSTATQLSNLAAEVLLLCDNVGNDAKVTEEMLAAITDNVEKLAAANLMFQLAAKAVDASSETIAKKALACLQNEMIAKDKFEKITQLKKCLEPENP